MALAKDYASVMSRKGEIMKKALGMDFSAFESGSIAFDYEKMMSSTGFSMEEVERVQGLTGVGNTPLFSLRNLTALARTCARPGYGATICVKDEMTNPSGSFKARRAACAVAFAKAHGYKGVIAATSGNYGAAVASQAAMQGLKCIIVQEAYDSREVGQPEIIEKARACEAMGAEVSYSPAAQTITAVRDGTTVTMALGGTTATVERSGVTTHIPMDAAPYAHDNRTYVPVRFAAQAFGCAVGWDAGARTVILIDMEKLVEETLSKYDFTYLEKYLAYGQKYRTGIWDLNADFDASLDMTGLLLGSTAESAPITLDGTLEGVMAGGAKMDAAMGLTMDLRPFLKALTDGQNGGMSASDTELLDALAEEGIHMELRGDLEAGQLYISLGGAFLEQAAGLPADTWYSMDMSAIYEDMGLDYGALMEMTTGDVDYTALLSLLLSTVEPNDKDTAYSELTQAVDLAAQLLRDDAWAVSGNDRILHYALEQDGVAADFTFTLTMRGDDVSAYDLSVELSADVDGSAPMSIFLQESMDADGRMEASMQCDAAGLMDLEFSMSGRYTEGKTAPETEPPKGAVVVDLTAPEAPADPVPTSGDPAEVVIDKIYTTGGGFIGVTEG